MFAVAGNEGRGRKRQIRLVPVVACVAPPRTKAAVVAGPAGQRSAVVGVPCACWRWAWQCHGNEDRQTNTQKAQRRWQLAKAQRLGGSPRHYDNIGFGFDGVRQTIVCSGACVAVQPCRFFLS